LVHQPAPLYDYSPPRPYSWQTDEFQTSKPETRKTQQINQVQPLNVQFPGHAQNQPQPLAFRPPQPMSTGYRCPRCMSNVMPRTERKISTGGWITFAVLLVTFFPLFWIGLLIKEDVHTCPACNMRIG
jgi:DNA-directed RNA polymerase subunit RPC12/RpoP